MYELYTESTNNPVKESFYRYIFCNKFNLDFHRPKSNKCGKCKEYAVAEKQESLTECKSGKRKTQYGQIHDEKNERIR